MPLPTVSPVADGGVVLEWGDDGRAAQLVVSAGGGLTVVVDTDGEIVERAVASPVDPTLLDALRFGAVVVG